MKIQAAGLQLSIERGKFEIKSLSPVYAGSTGSGGWWPLIREPFSGAWQRNMEQSVETVIQHPAVYSCVNLISQDIGKLQILVKQRQVSGVWKIVDVPTIARILRKPNRYQNYQQFKELWINSKLLHGNTYVLKQRDVRGFVIALYILDPSRVTPLIADDGGVYYRLKIDKLNNVFGLGPDQDLVVPASEIVHDRMSPKFHPLLGTPPLIAAALAASQGLAIQKNSRIFFDNLSQPGGFLTAPGNISDEAATRLEEHFRTGFTGANAGNIAILGDGLEFKPFATASRDAQMIEQLKWTSETICGVFHVPSFMVLGNAPTYNNVEGLGQQYYAQCLQSLIEAMELCLDEALEFDTQKSDRYEIFLDLSMLLRMDTATRFKAHSDAIKGGWKSPNEVRVEEDLEPVEGGDTPYMQIQNYSLAALAKRDERESKAPEPLPVPVLPVDTEDEEEDDQDEDGDEDGAKFFETLRKELTRGTTHEA